ncbi:MAG: di-trans,poly-cis-decaprenylcistransferase [Alphaproteobacteria bacterium 64-6]|nr:MAG: di-trans,poly-cis-decaprenylcistransferase [Alphaproteobacteria bacterium 64-6]
MQSSIHSQDNLHVAIIMDGNGRWATAKGLPRTSGHFAGIAALRDVVKAASGMGVATLSVYAFSSDNWRRPASEVAALMDLFRFYLVRDLTPLVEASVKLVAIGRRDRLSDELAKRIAHAEAVTARGTRLTLRLAIDYSSRDAILGAVAACRPRPTREELALQLAGNRAPADVDLLIRTGGEKRLSDFLLWEAAYAELYFTDRLWPDFRAHDLALALGAFRARDRRFGGLSTTAGQPTASADHDRASCAPASAP